MQPHRNNSSAQAATEVAAEFKTLAISSPKPFVFHVELNRPKKLNAINKDMWL